MVDALSPWVLEAAKLPVAFAQVREDPLLDQWVVDQLGPSASVAMIASGGCTAALLATSPNLARLHLVDANPAQILLTKLKLRSLNHDHATRCSLLGHAPADSRQSLLSQALAEVGTNANALGPIDVVARLGPDHAGRYERVFAALQDALRACKAEIDALLRLHDLAEQARRAHPDTPLGQRLDAALDSVMALPNLVRLFGEEATKNPVEPFSRHFARRIRHALATLPTNTNPYLWQMLKGVYPEKADAPWLSVAVPSRLPDITWSNTFMAEALRAEPGAFDFVHLSNILDWLSPEKASATLEVAWQALRPSSWTLIRQLNSSLDIPSLGRMFEWHTAQAKELHARDRSFFYRALLLGRRR